MNSSAFSLCSIPTVPIKHRCVLTLKEKMEVIKAYELEKKSVRELARMYAISKTTAAGIVKNRDELRLMWLSGTNLNTKRSCRRGASMELDRMCYQWYLKARSDNVHVTGLLVKTKAIEIAEQVGYKSFQASDGWLHRFKLRHSIMFKNNSNNNSDPLAINPLDYMKLELKSSDVDNSDDKLMDEDAVDPNDFIKIELKTEEPQVEERLSINRPLLLESDSEEPKIVNLNDFLKVEFEKEEDTARNEPVRQCETNPMTVKEEFLNPEEMETSPTNQDVTDTSINSLNEALVAISQLKSFAIRKSDNTGLKLVKDVETHFQKIILLQEIADYQAKLSNF